MTTVFHPGSGRTATTMVGHGSHPRFTRCLHGPWSSYRYQLFHNARLASQITWDSYAKEAQQDLLLPVSTAYSLIEKMRAIPSYVNDRTSGMYLSVTRLMSGDITLLSCECIRHCIYATCFLSGGCQPDIQRVYPSYLLGEGEAGGTSGNGWSRSQFIDLTHVAAAMIDYL
jgi:hypothetical protein